MSRETGGQDGGMGADRVKPSGSQPAQPLSPEMPARLDEDLIAGYVGEHGGRSAGEIADALGYSRSGVAYVLERLADGRRVRCHEYQAGRVTRKLWWPA
jgi:hypothetical protein